MQNDGLVRDLNPGPLAPKARIIPLDQLATYSVEVSRGPIYYEVTLVWQQLSDCECF